MAAQESAPEAGHSSAQEGLLLRGAFQVKGLLYDVELLGSELKWDKNGRKDTSKFGHTTSFDEIISLATEDGSTQNKGQPENSFSLHYIIKHPSSHIWKVASTCFTAKDGATRDQWVDKIKEILHVKGAQRPKKLLVFVNPISGNKQGQKVYDKHAAPLFHLAGMQTDVVVTTHSKHITEHLQDYPLDTIDSIVCVGGDGTYSECANGLLLRFLKDKSRDKNDLNVELVPSHIPVGNIPSGTGQGIVLFATGTKDPVTAVLHIIIGNVGSDVAMAAHNDNKLLWFGTLASSYGFYGDAVEYSEARRDMGKMRYPVSMVKFLRQKKTNHLEIHYQPCKAEDLKKSGEEPDVNPSGVSTQGENQGAHSSLSEDGWKKIEGRFFDVVCYPTDLTGKYPSALHIHLSKRGTFTGMAKHFHRLANAKKDMFEFDWMENLEPSEAYRVVIKDFDKVQSEGATNSKDIPSKCLNVDGEPFQLTDPVFHVRLHRDVLRLHGTFPVLTRFI